MQMLWFLPYTRPQLEDYSRKGDREAVNTLNNGNELQSEELSDGSEVGLYDFNARTYNAQISRFLQIDSETKDQENFSPYHFGANNPIKFGDPDGKRPIPGFAIAIPAIVAGLEALGAATGLTVVIMQAVDKAEQVDWRQVMENIGSSRSCIVNHVHPLKMGRS